MSNDRTLTYPIERIARFVRTLLRCPPFDPYSARPVRKQQEGAALTPGSPGSICSASGSRMNAHRSREPPIDLADIVGVVEHAYRFKRLRSGPGSQDNSIDERVAAASSFKRQSGVPERQAWVDTAAEDARPSYTAGLRGAGADDFNEAPAGTDCFWSGRSDTGSTAWSQLAAMPQSGIADIRYRACKVGLSRNWSPKVCARICTTSPDL